MQEILPPLPESEPERKAVPAPTEPAHASPAQAEPAPDWLVDPDDLPPALAFTPVPRKRNRSNGLTPLRQRVFIAYLSANGSVEMSAKAIGASDTALYSLKKAEGAESFAAAWDAAIDMGARRVLDTLMDHAIHGTPEKLLKDGEIILERRKFNTRAMMWIVQQRFPEQYGGNLNLSGRPASSLPHGLQKLKEEWRAEWKKEYLTPASEEETVKAILKKLTLLKKRTWHERFVPWMDDAEKRAAADLLYGAQDWDLIQERAERDARGGAVTPASTPEP